MTPISSAGYGVGWSCCTAWTWPYAPFVMVAPVLALAMFYYSFNNCIATTFHWRTNLSHPS
jgi:hypothetical protein